MKQIAERFEIPADDVMAMDLARRLSDVRWADAVVDDWSQGTQPDLLRKLVSRWRDGYDWDARRTALNSLPHRYLEVDGFGLHFLHFDSGSDAVPLLLMNGWPSSFVEYQRLVPLLTQGVPAFNVVIPTHPGFGFTEQPVRPYQVDPVDLYPRLMEALGYDRFATSGTDVGSGIATRIALKFPERVVALHVASIPPRLMGKDEAPPTEPEIAYASRVAAWMADEGAYQMMQRSKPQTLAFALADSPVGLASWIVEKFHGWTDHDGDVLSVWPLDTILDNLMVYWMTNTIGSSIRYYYEGTRLRAPLQPEDRVRVPTGIAIWPADIASPPRELAERIYDVRRYSVMPRGGHFPAWEQPELYAGDLRALLAG